MRPDASSDRAAPQRMLTYRSARYWGRAVGFALWLVGAAVLPGAAIANTLGGLLLVVFIVGCGAVGRASLLARFIGTHERQFAKELRAAPRTRVRVVTPEFSTFALVLAGFLAWFVPFFVAGDAIRDHNLSTGLASVAIVFVAAWAMRLLFFAHPRVGLTVGRDGVAVDGQGFAAWKDVAKIAATHVAIRIGATRPALVLDLERGGENTRWTVPIDESGATILARELERRRGATPPEPEAGLEEARVTAGAPWRGAAVPVADLVRTLRDPGAARAERVRVAEILRDHAPEEVDRFAEETADAELEGELVRIDDGKIRRRP